jgi:hypothetical protein
MEAESADYEEQGGEETQADMQKQHYEGSAEGEYHYAAVDEQD